MDTTESEQDIIDEIIEYLGMVDTDPYLPRTLKQKGRELKEKLCERSSKGQGEARPFNAPGYTPEECKELVSDEEVEAAFENTNFGSMTNRAVIRHGLLKVAGGWYQGHTSNTILVELNLKKSMDDNELTLKGRRYLYASYDCFEKEGV